MNRKIYSALATAAMLTISGGVTTWAANVYTLDGIEVDANRQYDKFGNVITEQSYSRTGGDVTVITRQDIEKKHFQNITDAVKRVPGVHINDIGISWW